MRLDKFICKSTDLNQSDALNCILAGEVWVNGEIIKVAATQVHENNEIVLHGQQLKTRAFRYLLMHKQAGTICSNTDEQYPSLFNALDIDRVSELHIAGRLDADTTGLVLITDDGRWTFNITVPSKACPKVYRVGLSYEILHEQIEALCEQFKQGIALQGEAQLTLPAKLEVLSPKEVLLTITEGKYHQVKRMFAAVSNRVLTLHREQIGEVQLDVALGQWRYLTDQEVASFN